MSVAELVCFLLECCVLRCRGVFLVELYVSLGGCHLFCGASFCSVELLFVCRSCLFCFGAVVCFAEVLLSLLEWCAHGGAACVSAGLPFVLRSCRCFVELRFVLRSCIFVLSELPFVLRSCFLFRGARVC